MYVKTTGSKCAQSDTKHRNKLLSCCEFSASYKNVADKTRDDRLTHTDGDVSISIIRSHVSTSM